MINKKIICTFLFSTLLTSIISIIKPTKNINVEAATSNITPANIYIVTDANRSTIFKTKLPSNSGETYDPSTRQYAHCASCCQTGNRLWCAWNTGGPNEPDNDMYVALAYSDDFGETWVDPAIIIDYPGTTDYTPYLFMDDQNRFWITWNTAGTYAITIPNPEASMDKIRFTEMGKILPRSCSSTPIILKDGTYLAAMEGDMPFFKLMASTDKGKTWTERSTLESMANKKYWNEGHVVELSDGTIMYESRIEVGDGYEIFYSHDQGYTWGKPEYYKGSPFVSCGTKASFIKLSNGKFIFATNANTSKRVDLKVFISSDDCNTFSSGLLLDSSYCEYPTCCEMNDGRIFAVWTRERTKLGEIRCAVLTQEDILNGTYTNSKTMMLVSRANVDYKDVVRTNLSTSYTVDEGLSFDEVVAKLPQYVKVTANDKKIYPLEIEGYTCDNYQNKPGTYTFKYTISDEYFMDLQGILKINVVVKSKGNNPEVEPTTEPSSETNGCNGNAQVSIIVILILLAFIVRRKKLWIQS